VRRISCIKAALRDFQAFPAAEQEQMTTALRIDAHGEKADKAKPSARTLARLRRAVEARIPEEE
jgi:hypothetical protein